MSREHEGNMRTKILSIGEILWDAFGEEEYHGGAPSTLRLHRSSMEARRLCTRVAFSST